MSRSGNVRLLLHIISPLNAQHNPKVKKVAWYPDRMIVQSALQRPVLSNANIASLGSIQPRCNYCMKTINFVHISTTVYSQVLIQLSELSQHGVNRIDLASKRQQDNSKPDSLDWIESPILSPLYHCPSYACLMTVEMSYTGACTWSGTS